MKMYVIFIQRKFGDKTNHAPAAKRYVGKVYSRLLNKRKKTVSRIENKIREYNKFVGVTIGKSPM